MIGAETFKYKLDSFPYGPNPPNLNYITANSPTILLNLTEPLAEEYRSCKGCVDTITQQ